MEINEVEYYKKAIGKVTCAFKENIIEVDGKATVTAKRKKEREKYLFPGLKEDGSDNVVLIDSLPDELNLEFELHDSDGKKQITKEEILKFIEQCEENIIKLGLDYCVTDHNGTSPYIRLCNLTGLIEGKELECKKILANQIVPEAAMPFVDFSNFGDTLVPVINRQHWKPKYKGAIHKFIRGKNPIEHENFVGHLVADKIKVEENVKVEGRELLGNQLPITDVEDISKLKQHGEEWWGVHPVHGSTGGMNFWVNPSKNMWHCFRDNSGSDALGWLAVKEGICKCSDFSQGGKKLKGDDYFKTLQIAKEKHNLIIPEPETFLNKDLQPTPVSDTQDKLANVDYSDIELVSGKDVKNLPIPDAEEIVEGKMLIKNSLNFYIGKSGAYKSYTAAHIAYCISEGKKVFGRYKTIQQKVWYINEENCWPIFKPMIENVRKGLNTEGTDNLIISTYQSISLDPTNVECRAKLEKIVRDKGIQVLVLDSLRRFFTFEENDAGAVNNFCTVVLKPLMAKYNLTVIAIAHTKKENVQFKWKTDKKDLFRGSSDWVNIADGILFWERGLKPLFFNLYQLKCRVAEEFQEKTIKIIADPVAGFGFEELTTAGKDAKQNVLDMCVQELIRYIFDKKLRIFVSDKATRDEFIAKGYVKTYYQEALVKLVDGKVLTKDTRGNYKVDFTNPVFDELEEEEDRALLESSNKKFEENQSTLEDD